MEETKAVQEERRRLEDTKAEIERQLSAIGPRYYGDDFVEMLLDEKREENRRRLEALRGEPYFGRLDFREDGRDSWLPLYIGKRGMSKSGTDEPYVIDWRAPVASLFYTFTGGDEPVAYEAPDGTIRGDIRLKRNLQVRFGELQRVVDAYVRGGDNLGLSDEFLLYRLGERKDNKLRDIVSTIQAEQDRIIRADRRKALIIQGAAGSGKTTVALHRLAYLLYRYQDVIKAEKMIIFAPNAMFLDYISGVLPELGVGDVRQTTFAAWALERLAGDRELKLIEDESKRHFSLQPHTARQEEAVEPARIKGSLDFLKWLDAELVRFERESAPAQDFVPWEGARLEAAEIAGWMEAEYRDYPLAARLQRVEARMNRWLEMRLNETADPRKRKERAKSGRQKLRAYVSKLPSASAVGFYRSLLDPRRGGLPGSLPEQVAADTWRYLGRGEVRGEDLAPLLWIHVRFNGSAGQLFHHVVVDEAQDVSPFQIALLNQHMREPSFTILGDLAQGIHDYRGVRRWEELLELFGPEWGERHELRQSYRSTLEIIEFANLLIPRTETGLRPAQPVFRSGEPVALRQTGAGGFPELARAFIEESRNAGMATMAVIGRTVEDCDGYCEALRAIGADVNLITEGQTAYRGGLSVVPVHLAKGLEFDAVLLPDADEARYAAVPRDAKLLYVAATRALHRLTVSWTGELTPLLRQAAELAEQ